MINKAMFMLQIVTVQVLLTDAKGSFTTFSYWLILPLLGRVS